MSDDLEFEKWKDVWASFEPVTEGGSELLALSWHRRLPAAVLVDVDSNQFLKASLESLRQRRTRVVYGEGLALFLGVLMFVTTLVVEFDQSRRVAAIVAFGFIALMGLLLEIEKRRLERSLRVYVRLQAELFGEVMGLDLQQTPEHLRLWGGSRKKRRRRRTS